MLLAAAGLGVDRRQALPWVGLGDRQVAEQERVTIAELVRVLTSVMHAHRNLDSHRLHRLVVSPKPAPDRPRHHGQQDVVDRHPAPCGVLDPLQVVQLAGGEGDLAIAADSPVERRIGPQRPQLASQRSRQCRQLAPGLTPAPRRDRRTGTARQGAADPAQPGCSAGDEQLRPSGRGLRLPLFGRTLHDALVHVPEQLGEHPQTGDPVRQAVVDANHQHRLPVLARARDVDAPQRPGMVQALGHHPPNEAHQRRPVRDRLGCQPDVIPDLEALVVHPRRRGNSQWGGRQPLPGSGHGPKPRLYPAAQALHGQRLPVGRRVDDHQLQRVSGDRVGLEPQDAGVVGAQSLHGGRLHGGDD